MRRLIISTAAAAAIAVMATGALAKKTQVYRATGGTNVAQVGLSIDASYDQRFDDFVPGYKVINVAMINQSFNIIFLDPERDRWSVTLAGKSKPVIAIHDLRRADPKAWTELTEKSKNLLAYPLFIPVGARQVIDVFVPDTVDLAAFNEVGIYIKSLDARIEILARQ